MSIYALHLADQIREAKMERAMLDNHIAGLEDALEEERRSLSDDELCRLDEQEAIAQGVEI